MTSKLKKYSVLIIVAVLLVAMAFAGAANATHIATAQELADALNATSSSAGTATVSGNTVTLQMNAQLNSDEIVFVNDPEAATPLPQITLDLNGFSLIAYENHRLFSVGYLDTGFFGSAHNGNLVLDDTSDTKTGKLIGNGTVSGDGGGVYIEYGTFTMNGGSITGCNATIDGGGVLVYSCATFIMNGGNITGCSASGTGSYGGGGVFVYATGYFNVNGTATITDNYKGTEANNVCLRSADKLKLLAGGFTGRIGINNVASANPSLGAQFGTAEAGATGAENFFNDKGGLAGYIDTTDNNKLMWTEGSYTASQWNALTDADVTALSGTVYIVDLDENAVIYPKYNGSSSPAKFAIQNDLTLDFISYKGKFAGEPSATSENKGALFGHIENASYTGTLTIKNLTMKDTKVASSSYNVGGIIGYFQGEYPEANLNFTNCNLVNCSVNGTSSSSNRVGGLVGLANYAIVNVENCRAMRCDIMAGSAGVGGLVGCAAPVNFVGCNLAKCTVASTGSGVVGGLVGYAGPTSIETSGVANSSIYGGSDSVGGLVGYASIDGIVSCTVKNCVIASGSVYVGGLVGYAECYASGITNSAVQNTALNGRDKVGGLVGYASSLSGTMSGNSVEHCAVKGTATSVHLDCGNKPGQIGCTDTTGSYLNNGTARQPLITVYPHTVTPQTEPIQYGNITVTKISNIGLLTDAKTAASYVVYETTPVVFDPCNGSTTYAGTISLGDTTIAKPVRAGYAFSGWNLTSSAGTMLTDKDGTLQASVSGYTNASHQWNNASGATVNLFANWTVNETKVNPTENYVKFSNDNITALNSDQDKVTKIVLENVTQIEIGNEVNFTAENTSLYLPELDGYTKINEICLFEIGAVKESGKANSSIILNVTFENAQTASENKDKAIFLHYNTVNNAWDTTPLVCSLSQSGKNVQYLVHTTTFSPFGVGIYTPTPSPSYSSSSSKHTGYTQILQEVPTVAPTAAPTTAPSELTTPTVVQTANTTTQQTQQSPVPLVGLIVGLGVAALYLNRMRR